MRSEFRTTVRFDLSKPDEQQAAELLQKLNEETGLSYAKLISPAVLSYYYGAHHPRPLSDDDLREKIRQIVREEMLQMPITLGELLKGLQITAVAPEQIAPPESDEPDEEDLDDAFDCFGS